VKRGAVVTGTTRGEALFGRDRELRRLRDIVDAVASDEGAALVLAGPAGIGKSSLLRATARAARLPVRHGSGAEPELGLPFAVLHQLLVPLLHRPSAHYAAPARAVRNALVRDGSGPELVVGPVVDLLTAVARNGMVFVVDDAHWSDEVSLDVLLRLSSRPGGPPVGVLLAAQDTSGVPSAARAIPRLDLAPLDAAASTALLSAVAGGALPASVNDQILAWGAGNPRALTELAASLSGDERSGRRPVTDPGGRAGDTEREFVHRAAGLSGGARDLLLLAAVETEGDLDPTGPGGWSALAPTPAAAEVKATGLVGTRDGRPGFCHPLAAAAVLRAAVSADRRRAHRRLAERLTGDGWRDRRAWHLAEASDGRDEEVARLLEGSAGLALERGGYAAAAAALERAAVLTVDEVTHGRRLVRAAEASWRAGLTEQAGDLLARARRAPGPVAVEARASFIEGSIAAAGQAPADAFRALVTTAELARDREPGLSLESLAAAAQVAWWTGQSRWVEEVAVRVRSVGPVDHADVLLREALIGSGHAFAGEPGPAGEHLTRALEQVGAVTHPRLLIFAGQAALLLGDDLTAQRHLEAALAGWRGLEAVSELPFTLALLAGTEAWRGHLSAAQRHAQEGADLADRIGDTRSTAFHLSLRAHICGLQGDEEPSRAAAAEALRLVTGQDVAFLPASALWALGRLDLGRGRPVPALEHLTAIVDPSSGRAHPMVALFAAPDLVEAACRAGRRDLAEPALRPFERWAAAGSTWATAVLPRLRGLLASAADAEACFAGSPGGGQRPFDEGRHQLLYGEHLRRTRQRVRARTELRAALEQFDALGLRPWVERAQAELLATGEHARRRVDHLADRLTPQEVAVARIVAAGATNQEVAAQLFISRKTVESHLHKTYTKLRISARSQLADALDRHLGPDYDG
jgi:DNA-binding CsgD family transcriptional regulator/tetratricopeptide (TPR) repeat protein